MKNILSIAASDSSGGAGVQGDLKTITAHRAHALSVVTAITAQNTTEITSIFPVGNVSDQLLALKKDIRIDAIKIGMLYTDKNVHDVIRFIEEFAEANRIPIVLDPLMFSTTKKALVSEEAQRSIENKLIPLVSLVTPNLLEAEYLSGIAIDSKEAMVEAVTIIYDRIKTPVLIKGGHLNGKFAIDVLYNGEEVKSFHNERVIVENTHGTGCCLSSSIACHLANGNNLAEAVTLGKAFVTMALSHGYSIGKGEGPVDPLIHFITNFVTMNDVANTCIASGGRPLMAEAIEEMKDIVPVNNGLVINLGTLSKSRLELMMTALNFINPETQHVLLDPVGCSSSTFRLKAAKEIFLTGKISILKMNPREAMALLNENEISDYGVDSDEIDSLEKERLAIKLLERYSRWNEKLIVIITGKVDIIASKEGTHTINGGTQMQKKITGTGCMLNAVVMTFVAKSSNPTNAVVNAVKHMNNASKKATKKLKNKKYIMSYKELLINELSYLNKDIYLITDEKLDFNNELIPRSIKAFELGITTLQYRAKNKSDIERYDEAMRLREITTQYGIIFIVNDDIKLAQVVKADGVHLGKDDGSIKLARIILGDQAIIGATAKTVEQAIEAEKFGADYLGVGAINPSPTKPEAIPLSLEDLKNIRRSVNIPLYGIGGIRHSNLTQKIIDCIDGVAVVSAVYEGEEEEIKKILNALER